MRQELICVSMLMVLAGCWGDDTPIPDVPPMDIQTGRMVRNEVMDLQSVEGGFANIGPAAEQFVENMEIYVAEAEGTQFEDVINQINEKGEQLYELAQSGAPTEEIAEVVGEMVALAEQLPTAESGDAGPDLEEPDI